MKRWFLVLAAAALLVAGEAQAATPEQKYRTAKTQVARLQQQLVELESPVIGGWSQIMDEDAYVYMSRQLDRTWRSYVYWRRVLFDPYTAIRYVFGPYTGGAWNVALCEGGRPVPSIHAQNGQYEGMFQMGSGERRRYGHGNYALAQARAAYAYFAASGYDWSPWGCKP